MNHILLTVLGKEAKDAEYVLEGRSRQARLAPVALFNLVPSGDRPTCVYALCTREASQTAWPVLQQALEGQVRVESIPIPSGDEQEDVDGFLRAVVAAVPEQATITVDVTHGYRHFSFLMFVGALYLVALRRVRVRAIYYGLLRSSHQGPSPFIDLSRLLHLTQWIHALRVFQETGSALAMSELIYSEGSQTLEKVSRELREISQAHSAGLPLEFGRAAEQFLQERPKALRKALRDNHKLPLAEEVVGKIEDLLKPLSLPLLDRSAGWKGKLHLDQAELLRQAKLIDNLLDREMLPAAMGLLREWTVSWAEWLRGQGKDWLSRTARSSAESALGAMTALAEAPSLRGDLTAEQQELARFWKELRDLRNTLHHHAMREEPFFGRYSQSKRRLEVVRHYWNAQLRSIPRIDLEVGPKRFRTLLVSPLGNTPGVLFSAVGVCLQAAKGCDACLVICSAETEPRRVEALKRAGFEVEEDNARITRFRDPYGGLEEMDQLLADTLRFMLDADQLLVNVTGGTTLMGLLAEKIADQALAMALPVRRFGLIDRRPREQQFTEPYQQSEVYWLDNDNRYGSHDDGTD